MLRRSEKQMLFAFLAAAAIVIPLGIWIFTAAPPSVPQEPTSTDRHWRAALSSGDGDDWVALSTRDKMALCLGAAELLEKDEATAWAYREFLGTFYEKQDPVTRSQTISQTISVCQSLIDNGTIDVER